MRIRTIKPEWLDDERLVLASAEARVLSIALILLADDHGRGRASTTILAGRVFPGSANPRETLAKALVELASLSFVVLYEVDGQSYFAIRNWEKHQRVDRPGRPQVPPPPNGNVVISACSDGHANIRETHAKVPETHATDQDQEGTRKGEERESHAGVPARETAAPPKSGQPTPRHVEAFERSLAPSTDAHAAVVALVSETRKAAGGAPFRTVAFADREAVQKLAEWSAAPDIGPERLRASLAAFWATKGTGARLSWLTEEDPGRFLGRRAARASGMTPASSAEEHTRDAEEAPSLEEQLARFRPRAGVRN